MAETLSSTSTAITRTVSNGGIDASILLPSNTQKPFTPEELKELAEAESVREKIKLEKIDTLRYLLQAGRPTSGTMPGSEQLYEPVLLDEKEMEIIRKKILEIVATL